MAAIIILWMFSPFIYATVAAVLPATSICALESTAIKHFNFFHRFFFCHSKHAANSKKWRKMLCNFQQIEFLFSFDGDYSNYVSTSFYCSLILFSPLDGTIWLKSLPLPLSIPFTRKKRLKEKRRTKSSRSRLVLCREWMGSEVSLAKQLLWLETYVMKMAKGFLRLLPPAADVVLIRHPCTQSVETSWVINKLQLFF